MDVAAALRRFRLVPSVAPRVAAGYWQYKEQQQTIATGATFILGRNPDRALLIFSGIASTNPVTVSPFPTVTASNRGFSLTSGGEPLVLDFATYGPMLGYDWYCRSIGPSGSLWILEGIYLPK